MAARDERPDLAPDELPDGFEPGEVLARSERSVVVRGRLGGDDVVVRLAAEGVPDAGVAAEVEVLGRVAVRGLAAPSGWGRSASGRVYTVRPWVDGLPFDVAAARQPERVEGWAHSLLLSLAALHDAGLVHRDVKSANVLVGEQGPVLIDLDLVSYAGQATAGGTRLHIAPEVLLGQPPGPRADLFSLGVMLALALLGGPPRDPPGSLLSGSFWEVTGLEASRLQGELGSLVRQLVHRHPADRPVTARAAARSLRSEGLPPETALPFLAGREEALRRLVGAVSDIAGRHVVLVDVADADERVDLLEHLEVALAVAGMPVARLLPGEDVERQVAAGARPLLACQADVPGGGGQALTELLAAFGVLLARESCTLVVLADGAVLQQALDGLRQRGLHEEASAAVPMTWPRVPVASLTRHLDDLSGGATPGQARRLARSIHAATLGRWRAVCRALQLAESAGVWRIQDEQLVLLRDEWPTGVTVGAGHAVDDPDEHAVLSVLSVVRTGLPFHDLAALAERPPTDVRAALARLGRAGVVEDRDGAFALRDPSAVVQAEDPAALHRRCLALLEARGDAEQALWHRAASARTVKDERAVLVGIDGWIDTGRHAAARELLDVLQEARPARAAHETLRRREARLELAQGQGARALELLEAWTAEGAAAEAGTWLVAAHAAEQGGHREQARELNQRVLDGKASRPEQLQALVGLAYADFLDGEPQLALERTDGVLRPSDSDEAAARVLNLRGVALARLGRLDEAGDELDRAAERGEVAGDPLLLARAELNRAHVDRRRGMSVRALASLERAEAAFDRAGHVQGRALALNNLGVLHRDRGDLARARRLLEGSLALRRRVGDRHGAASSLGSLAAVALDAGHVGLCLELGRLAGESFAEGGYESEQAFVALHRVMALALAGRAGEAADEFARLDAVRLETAQPLLMRRAEALLAWVAGDRPRARGLLEQALASGADDTQNAERARAAAWLLALDPRHAGGASALAAAAEALDAPVRRAEHAWRTSAPGSLPARAELQQWLEVFEAAGRTDLVRAVAEALAQVCDDEGDAGARRAAAARVGQAADALTDGLPAEEHERVLERLRLVASARATRGRRAVGLSVDWLLAANRRMATADDLDGLLLTIVDMALEVTSTRRGFLVLVEGDEVRARVARRMDQAEMAPDEVRFSHTVVQESLTTGQAVLSTDAGQDERFAQAVSIATLELRSVLCVPLPGADGPLGALYLDDDRRREAFDETDIERVRALADQAALAIGNLQRVARIEELSARLAERVDLQERELRETRAALRRRGDVSPVGGLVGESEAMREVFAMVQRVAPTDLSVLVTGPSGSGKDLVARALHSLSGRADGPLVIENVAAVPATLLESELFGHVRGAFTGADRDRPGLFAEADGGTFVLDEIGELPLELQPKLLRVLESGEVRPVGGRRARRVDVRIVAATNRDLLDRVHDGEFREDLYYRLNAVEVRLPSLAERVDDVPRLVQHFLDLQGERYGVAKPIASTVLAALARRPWPGQVRELANEVARLYALSDAEIDDPGLVRPDAPRREGEAMPDSLRLEDVERAAIERALRVTDGRKDKAAELLGISRAGLYAKIRRLGVGGAGRDSEDDDER